MHSRLIFYFFLVSCVSELLVDSSITGYLGGIHTFKSQFVAINFMQRLCIMADHSALLFNVWKKLCSALITG